MSRTISIDPVTRIEGHAKVFVDLDDNGTIENAGLVVNELRGFERILVGMEAAAMPQITARICGVCPTAHLLAAVKAIDAAAGVEPPPAGKKLRELLYMGHYIHSHALHLFALAGPDLIFGIDAPAAQRNIVGIVEAEPEIAKKALRLRTIGQQINERVGGRGVHPVTAVVGGMSYQLEEQERAGLEKLIDEGISLGLDLAGFTKNLVQLQVDRYPQLVDELSIESYYMGTVAKNGSLNLYDGNIRVINPNGEIVTEFSVDKYDQHLIEKTYDWSYMKPVYFRNNAETEMYRVNTLARINVADLIETEHAAQELQTFRASFGRPCHKTVLHHYARLIELIYTLERAKQLIGAKNTLGPSRVTAKFNGGRGIGHVEAPRGTLIHDYTVDERGIVREANLIVATQQNYAAINKSITQAASLFKLGESGIDDEKALNAVEFAIRCYDPCLSCATHAVGRMPLALEFRNNGKTTRSIRRK